MDVNKLIPGTTMGEEAREIAERFKTNYKRRRPPFVPDPSDTATLAFAHAALRESCDFLVLKWTCSACGWETTVTVPGFAGDGYNHFPDGSTPCGPLVASRASNSQPKEPT